MLRTILVVDDNEVNRKILCNILKSDYRTLEATDGEEALSCLRDRGQQISAVLLDLVMPVMDGYQVLERMRGDSALSRIPVIVTTSKTEVESEAKALTLGANDYIIKPYNPTIIRQRVKNTINLRETSALVNTLQKDPLTGLYNRETFFDKAATMIAGQAPGYYVMACFDIDHFKVVNDQYGNAKGDEILIRLAEIFQEGFAPVGGLCGRIMADHFAMLYPVGLMDSPHLETIRQRAGRPDAEMEPLSFSIGRYIATDISLSASAMYDRACIAQASVKARFDNRIAQYNEAMRESILREQEIIGGMNAALENGQFEVWFQPQYNHSSGALIGAEALARWRHPEKGIIPPGDFIPVFERNGFIYEMDKNIWEQTCRYLRKWLGEGRAPLPVSVNVSRYDMFREDFFGVLTGLIKKYNIPLGLLRLEITESAFSKSTDPIIRMVRQLKEYGFTIEIDDFGSGYSSLNTLKDVPADILKLDMRFLKDNDNSARGGNILESVVRMAKWLGMPVIAEGVETKAQADYLRSIGCFYIQGYLYGRPMPAKDYENLAPQCDKEPRMVSLETVESLDNDAFWDPNSMETLIFNSYVGGTCIFEYNGGKIELLRVNEKYARELGAGALSMEDALSLRLEDHLDGEQLAILRQNVEKAVGSDAEFACELCLTGLPGTEKPAYIHAAVRRIARAGTRSMLYCAILNITAQREAELRNALIARQLEAVVRQQRETNAKIESDHRALLSLMNDTPGGFARIRLRANGSMIPEYCNDGFCEMVGMTRERLMALYQGGILAGVHPEDRQAVEKAVADMLNTGETRGVKYRLLHGAGGYVWVMIFGRKTQSARGDIALNIYYTNLSGQEAKDLSFQNLLPAALKARMASSPDLFFAKNRELAYICCSRTFAQRVGLADESQIIGKTDADLFDGELAGRYQAEEKRLMESARSPANDAGRIPGRNGAPGEGRIVKRPLYDAGGHVIGLYGVGRDQMEPSHKTTAEKVDELVWRLVAEHSNRLIFRYDIAAQKIYADSQVSAAKPWLALDENAPEAILAKGIVRPESVADYRRVFREMAEGRQSGAAKLHMQSVDAAARWVEMKYSLIDAEDQSPKSAVLSFLDITESHERELAYKRYLQTIDQKATAEGVLLYLEADVTANITEKMGGALATQDLPAKGSDRDKVIESLVHTFVAPCDRERCGEFFSREHLITAFSDGVRSLSGEWPVYLTNQRPGFARGELQMVQDPYTGHIKSYTILRDVTREKRTEMEVKRQAEQDGMTGLYNKATAETLIRRRLAQASGHACALLLVDLDNLKAINDSHGHAYGDCAIRQIGETLSAQFRKADIVGRVGGDEFIVFLENCGTQAWLRGAILALMKKLAQIHIGDQGRLPLRGSVGVSMGEIGKENFDTLFQQADRALYHVKRNGKNDFAFYTPEMEAAAYRFTAHEQEEWGRENLLNKEELERLLSAVETLYPLVLSANLSENCVSIIQWDHDAPVSADTYDELMKKGAEGFRESDGKAFLDTFSREKLLAAHAKGARRVSHTGARQGDGGAYRQVRTEAIFAQCGENKEIWAIILGGLAEC